MRFPLLSLMGAGLLATMIGCESKPAPGPTTPRGEIDVNTRPGDVDVKIDRDADGKKAVDVDVSPGGVNVDVDGREIRQGIQERREERREERATNP